MMTFGALADNDCVRLLEPVVGARAGGEAPADPGDRFELRELLELIAVFMAPRTEVEMEYVRPRRKGGGS